MTCLCANKRFILNLITRRTIYSTPQLNKKQSLEDHRNHINRTSMTPRLRSFRPLTVVDVKSLSPTVKGITFQPTSRRHTEDLAFKAGQWVDMMIPHLDMVGGFSICNSPEDYRRNNRLMLAVKFSMHPPAFWCNTKCKIGDQVAMRIGGKCYYEYPLNPKDHRPMLLVGGGVGINPLLSIFMHRNDSSYRDMALVRNDHPIITHLILSSRTREEWLFEQDIRLVCEADSSFNCDFYMTQEEADDDTKREFDNSRPNIRYRTRRLEIQDFVEPIERMVAVNGTQPNAYICGPPHFIEWAADELVKAGLDKKRVLYEKWW